MMVWSEIELVERCSRRKRLSNRQSRLNHEGRRRNETLMVRGMERALVCIRERVFFFSGGYWAIKKIEAHTQGPALV